MNTVKTDVLVVGAGPVGLLSALLLDKAGLDYLVVEQRATLHNAPQAHVISSRSLEICRSVGINDLLIREAGPDPLDIMNIRWVDRLIGRDLGVFSLQRDTQAIQHMLATTPTPTTNLSQDQFESLLYAYLPDKNKVRFEHTWDSFESSASGCVSVLKGPQDEKLRVESSYLIGADGAGSRVRKALGATMVGPDNIQTYVNIHFSANLREQLKGREALLYWVMEEECSGVFIAHDIENNWIFMKAVDADECTDPIDEAKFSEALHKAIGADVALTIHSMNSWRMTAQISDAYQSERVFLVGDAAHRFPPTGGIGMNTGFQDAHNLIWKIAMVEHGWHAALLDTYGPERKPVAEANSAQSLYNAGKMSEVEQLLDADDDKQITLSDLDTVMGEPQSRARVQAAIDNQAAHFNMSGLDLGFCYDSGAVLADGTPPQSDNPVSHYLPSTTPGARLPHAWLVRDGERISTLDLVDYNQLLVVSSTPDDKLNKTVDDLCNAGYPIRHAAVATDTELKPADHTFNQLFADDVLLVRPDGHIAARMPASAAVAKLGTAVSTLFPHS